MLYFGLFIILVGVDQTIKYIVLRFFNSYALINASGPFSIKGHSYLFALLGLIIIGVFLFAIKKQASKDKNLILPIVLIISGGISNIIDRTWRGGVVDFIDLKIWPSFNLADILITFGVALVILNEIKRVCR